MKKIEAAGITAFEAPVTVKTSSGKKIKGSLDHLLMSNDLRWKKIKDLAVGDFLFSKEGVEIIESIKHHKTKCFLYDLQVAEVKEFYANGIVSHNSSISEAIVYALFNKSYRGMNKPNLVNSINDRDCLVELDFESYGIPYTVRRGMKPHVFEVIKNGKPVDALAAARDQQEFFERTILRTTFQIFTQVVLMGTASYVPFMQLPVGRRREVVEKLLDLEILTKMSTILKNRVATWKEKNELINRFLFESDTKIDAKQEFIDNFEQLKANAEATRKKELKNLSVRHKELASALAKEKAELGDTEALSLELSGVSEHVITLARTLSVIEHSIKKIDEDIKFLESHDNCDVCMQAIEASHKKMRLKTLNEESGAKLQEKKENEELKNSAICSESELKTAIKLNRDIAGRVALLESQIEAVLKRAKEIKAELEDDQTKHLEKAKIELAGLLERRSEYETMAVQMVDNKDLYDLATKLFKDSGIKAQIIKKYVPQINKMMNKYLGLLGFPILFEIDENFDERIKSRYRDDFSYWSFSMGERQRIDLAMLFTWREIAGLRNSLKTNLLFFDEIFDSSLDSTGIDEMMGIFDSLGEHTNVFVISHRGEMFAEKFGRHINVSKVKGFSTYVEA